MSSWSWANVADLMFGGRIPRVGFDGGSRAAFMANKERDRKVEKGKNNMNGKLIKTFEAGRFSFEVWEGVDDHGPCYATIVRCRTRAEGRWPPPAQRARTESLRTAMEEATSLANRLQLRAEVTRPEKSCIEYPPLTPGTRPGPSAARLFGIDGLLKKPIVEGGSADKAPGQPPTRGGIHVLSRSSDSLQLLIKKEEEL